MNGTERNLSLGKKYLDAPDIASIRLNLLPKTKTYLTQRIISSTVIAGGIALMNLGWQSWNDAAVARTEEQFDEDLKQGDNRAIGGVVGTTLGSVVLLYFSKKREDK